MNKKRVDKAIEAEVEAVSVTTAVAEGTAEPEATKPKAPTMAIFKRTLRPDGTGELMVYRSDLNNPDYIVKGWCNDVKGSRIQPEKVIFMKDVKSKRYKVKGLKYGEDRGAPAAVFIGAKDFMEYLVENKGYSVFRK